MGLLLIHQVIGEKITKRKGADYMSEQQFAKVAYDIERSIKIALLNRDMTQKELAELINANPQQLNRAIKGDMTPKSRELREQVAEILHMEKE